MVGLRPHVGMVGLRPHVGMIGRFRPDGAGRPPGYSRSTRRVRWWSRR
jgi:hypothetical protein